MHGKHAFNVVHFVSCFIPRLGIFAAALSYLVSESHPPDTSDVSAALRLQTTKPLGEDGLEVAKTLPLLTG